MTAPIDADKLAGLVAAFAEISGPAEPGGFVGDIYFGDPDNSTRGTHRWNGSGWYALPPDADVLCQMPARERAKLQALTSALAARDKTIADMAAANGCMRVQLEALQAIADLTEISDVEFKREHPELNSLLDAKGYDEWGIVLSEFAARAWLAGKVGV